MIPVQPERFLSDLHALRQFGAAGVGKGVVRPAYSDADIDAREWLAGRYQDAGLDVRFDPVGSVWGLSGARSLLVGSHSDSQPEGGWLDGALGVICGLELARAARESGGPAISAVSFQDEEGRFGVTTGSRVWSGATGLDEADRLVDKDGIRFADARARMAHLAGDFVDPALFSGFLECHIEQGPWLFEANEAAGVVTDIVGIRDMRITFEGEQNHAGTTPMPLRQDAGIALMTFGYRLDHAFRKIAGPRSVWTMGRAQFLPGAASIIPGAAELHLQFRDPEDATLDRLQDCAFDLAGELNRDSEVKVSIDVFSPPTHPARMDEGFQKHMARSAEKFAPGQWQSMPSAAVHDAMFVANVMPAGMLFIPSINGISHDFSENSHDSDIVLGCEVFADAVASILNSSNH